MTIQLKSSNFQRRWFKFRVICKALVSLALVSLATLAPYLSLFRDTATYRLKNDKIFLYPKF